jgi:murein DD-endopeptidase MepM/ murein hydrolase activator NlpD
MVTQTPMNLWLPYPSGVTATCVQGAMSCSTHKELYAWDFDLPPNTPIVCVQRGRVVLLMDENTPSRSDNGISNAVFVDHGGARFATYLHHRPYSAQVKLGEIVRFGTKLAEVGSSGTFSPHLHFDVRGSNWITSHNVRFIGSQNQLTEVVEGNSYLSATPAFAPNDIESFEDSVLEGGEFLANGIRLESGLPAYSFPAESEIIFHGSALKNAQHVFFHLWKMGRTGPDLTLDTTVDQKGVFTLRVCIPERFTGCYLYKITARNRSGRALLPAWIH